MHILGLEIRKDRREKKYSGLINCFGCGKKMFVSEKNLRTSNYCSAC